MQLIVQLINKEDVNLVKPIAKNVHMILQERPLITNVLNVMKDFISMLP